MLIFPKKHSGYCYSTAGIHPHDAKSFDGNAIPTLKSLAVQDHVVAVGECGLDYDRNFSTPEKQRFVFEEQLKLATQLSLPVFLHERAASKDFISILSEYRKDLKGAVVHCFTSDQETLEAYLKLDCHIGITGWICDKRRGDRLREIVKIIPLDKLMIETDAPYLTPHNMPVRVRRNEPCFLPYVLRKVAECMGLEEKELAEKTRETTLKFFNLPK